LIFNNLIKIFSEEKDFIKIWPSSIFGFIKKILELDYINNKKIYILF